MTKVILKNLSEAFEWQLLATSLIALAALLIGVRALAAESSTVKVDGSSTVFPITEAVAEEFQAAQKGIKVTVGISGTGGGFKKFCRGETDVQDASRPIQASEMEDCKKAGVKFIELPVAFDAIVVVVNPKSTWLNEISVDELKKIWSPEAQGKILKWNQVNSKWPDSQLKLYGPSTDNGTFDYFTEAIVGKSKSSRGDYTPSADPNPLVQGIATDSNALGYFGLAYYEANRNRLKALALIGGEKSPQKQKAILPSKETVENGNYFPLSRPIFIYLNEASLKRSEVQKFAEFYMQNAGRLASEVKYISLPAKVYATAQEHLKKQKLGTVFGGHSEVGMKIEELMKREGKM